MLVLGKRTRTDIYDIYIELGVYDLKYPEWRFLLDQDKELLAALKDFLSRLQAQDGSARKPQNEWAMPSRECFRFDAFSRRRRSSRLDD